MAAFLLWFAFWLAGGAFGPVQYHPDPTAAKVVAYHEAGVDK